MNCSSLEKLDLSSFNTKNVTNMETMFHGCSSLTKLDLRNFDMNNLTNSYSMFGYVPTVIEIITNTSTKSWIEENFPELKSNIVVI